MRLAALRDISLDGKRVLVRVDFNVTVGSDGVVDGSEDYRLKAALPTIRELQQRRCKLILITHLGRTEDGSAATLEPVQRRLQELLNEDVRLTKKLFGPEVESIVGGSEPGSITLLPNVRFDSREESNNAAFGEQLAASGEAYVNEAFSASHRAHASLVQLPKLLPSCAGKRTVLEVEKLSALRDNPQHPYIAIISGAKVSTKERLLKALLAKVDLLCVGGRMANVFLAAQGVLVDSSFEEEELALAKLVLAEAGDKLLLPTEVVIGPSDGAGGAVQTVSIESIPANTAVWDVGSASVQQWLTQCQSAATILWNGPLGKNEVQPYDAATIQLARGLAGLAAVRIVGGGDTVNVLEQLKLTNNYDHVSVGGGAMLEFLEGKELPGLVPLYA